MGLTVTNAAFHDVAVAVLWIAGSFLAFATFAASLAPASKVGAAFPAGCALHVSADLAGSLGDLPAPCTLMLSVSPVRGFKLLGGRQRGNGWVDVEILVSAVVRRVGVGAIV